ncbi:MAG: ATP-binding protein, partial [Bacteroidota bacterium]
ASERQVIVFTHDIVFLTDLTGYCTAQGTHLRQSYLYRGPDQPGECIDGVPWAAMKVSSRIGRLKSWLQTAETIHRRQGSETYESEARRIYGRLRDTWERAVEEVLLNGVVIRFDHAIHTQQLNGLADITDDDIRTICEGMTKSSRFVHDQAGAVADPVPSPDELRQDINILDTWIDQVRRRRDRPT